jgi:hypothetical protein
MPEYYQPDVYALLAARQYNPQLLGYQRALAAGQGITDQLRGLGDDILRQKMLQRQQQQTPYASPVQPAGQYAMAPGGVRGAMQVVDLQNAMDRQRQMSMAAQLDAARAAQQAPYSQGATMPGGSAAGTSAAGNPDSGLNEGGALRNAFDYFTQSRRLQHALTAASNEDDYNRVADGIQALYAAARTNGLKVDAPEIEPWAGPMAPAGVGSISPDAPAVDEGGESVAPGVAAGIAPGAQAPATAGSPSQAGVDAGMVPAGAIQALQADPSLRDQFDAKYGTGLGAFMLGW